MERMPRKCFRCQSEDNLFSKCPKPPKENEKRKIQVHFNEIVNCASQKECENEKNKHNQYIYEFIAHMSHYDK